MVKNGRIRQSIMGWCFNPMPAPVLAKHCKDIGLVAMEGIGKEHYPAIKELGLDTDAYTDRESVVALLLEHPELMQRPIVSDGRRARIGRPPEAVRELLP